MTAPLGLIAGKGDLPRRAARELLDRGRRVIVAGLEPETEGSFPEVEQYRRFEPGQLGSLPEFFLDRGVEELIMLGDVDKTRLFDPSERDGSDSVVSGILDSVTSRGDLSLLKAAAKYLRVQGLVLRGVDDLFPDWLTPEGHLAGPVPTEECRRTRDVLLPVVGWLADNEIGQTGLGSQGSVVALEAVEGTRECIRRAGELAGENCVMVKRARSNQDLRFDVPVVGEETFQLLAAIGATGLFLEANSTVWIDRERCRQLADRHQLSFIGWEVKSSWKQWLPGFSE